MIDLRNLLIDIEDQRHYNSCGGQALSTYLEAIWFKFTGERREFSAAFLWRMALRESNKDGNVGVTPWSLFAVLEKYGCCLESDYPYTDENLNRFPTEEEIKKAAPYKIKKYASCRNEISKYLATGLPVFVLMKFVGGHFVDVFGERPGEKLIVNSWGTSWMDQGTQWIKDDEFMKRLTGAWVITKLPLTTVFAKKFNKLTKGLFKWLTNS